MVDMINPNHHKNPRSIFFRTFAQSRATVPDGMRTNRGTALSESPNFLMLVQQFSVNFIRKRPLTSQFHFCQNSPGMSAVFGIIAI